MPNEIPNNGVGYHILADLTCDKEKIIHTTKLKKIIDEVIKESGLNVKKCVYYQFKPYGATILYILSESHIAIHTWPELNYVALDIFVCANKTPLKEAKIKAERTLNLIIKKLDVTLRKVKCLYRAPYNKPSQYKKKVN